MNLQKYIKSAILDNAGILQKAWQEMRCKRVFFFSELRCFFFSEQKRGHPKGWFLDVRFWTHRHQYHHHPWQLGWQKWINGFGSSGRDAQAIKYGRIVGKMNLHSLGSPQTASENSLPQRIVLQSSNFQVGIISSWD